MATYDQTSSVKEIGLGSLEMLIQIHMIPDIYGEVELVDKNTS
jgi:hypothetical protein